MSERTNEQHADALDALARRYVLETSDAAIAALQAGAAALRAQQSKPESGPSLGEMRHMVLNAASFIERHLEGFAHPEEAAPWADGLRRSSRVFTALDELLRAYDAGHPMDAKVAQDIRRRLGLDA